MSDESSCLSKFWNVCLLKCNYKILNNSWSSWFAHSAFQKTVKEIATLSSSHLISPTTFLRYLLVLLVWVPGLGYLGSKWKLFGDSFQNWRRHIRFSLFTRHKISPLMIRSRAWMETELLQIYLIYSDFTSDHESLKLIPLKYINYHRESFKLMQARKS